MRRLLLLLMLLIPALAISANEIAFDDSVPDDIRAVLEESIDRWTEGRGEIFVRIGSYEEDTQSFDDRTLATFEAVSGDLSLTINAIGRDREALLESVETEVRNILFYEESLMAPGLRLDYVYHGSYSFLTPDYYRRGTRLAALDGDNRVRGLFEVAERYDGAVLLEPVFLSDPVPGLRLEDRGEWTLSLTAATGFDFSSPSVEVTGTVGRSDLIYPFTPLLLLTYLLSGGESYYYGGIGLGASLDLWRIFPTFSFTLVEEGRIQADASLLLGAGPDGFDWKGRFSVSYEHSPTPSFFWRLGYLNLQGEHMLILGGGGRF